VEIIRPSEHQLILKTYSKIQETISGIVGMTAFWIIIGFIYSWWIPVFQLSNLISVIPYTLVCFCALIFTYDHTATFDSATNSLRVEWYWDLFKKRHCQEYDLSCIRKIVVKKPSKSIKYTIVLKRFNNDKDIYVPCSESSDISIVEGEAQQIRDFLAKKFQEV
jgi:hypothetical protein